MPAGGRRSAAAAHLKSPEDGATVLALLDPDAERNRKLEVSPDYLGTNAGPRSARPGSAPVYSPSSTTGVPFTST